MRTTLVMALSILLAIASAGLAPATRPSPGRTGPFILGADVTWLLEDEAAGATYYDAGVKKDLLDLLKERGFNLLRVRVFVDPMSERGYARRMRGGKPEAWGDTQHLLTFARRAKAHDMQLLVDLHLSDNWADPEHQVKPVAWEKLPFDRLVEAARQHTRAVMTALKDQGTLPAYVQVGNEITHGMLWPDARVASLIPSGNAATDERMKAAGLEGLGHYDELATVLKACIAEVRQISPSTRIVLHNHLGRFSARVQEWIENLLQRGVDFDVAGFSCYAQGKEGDWEKTFNDVVTKYPQLDVMVLEYSARKRYVNDIVYNLPGKRGLGTVVWEPTRHREALFDQNGVNAGGGQASNYIEDLGVNQGATTRRAPATRAATAPTSRPRTNRGGRYDANAFLDLYPQMVKNYGIK